MEVSMFAWVHRKNSGKQARTPQPTVASGRRRRLSLVLLTAILPLGVAFSQSPVVARAALATNDCGTWAMLQVSKTSAMTFFTPSINAALAIPGVKGLSLRAPWTAITSNLTIFDMGVQLAAADHSALAIRFLAGKDTPSQFLGNSTKMGTSTIPLPWGAGSTPTSFVPNTTFEAAYSATVHQLAAYALLHGIRILHLPWYSGATAEIYDGPEVVKAPGYSTANFLAGYERLMSVGLSVAGPNLAVEYPLGGVGTAPFVKPLEAYMASITGAMNPDAMVQFNDLTSAMPGPQHPATGVNMTRQMQGQGDFNWTNVYQTLHTQGSQAVEIYLQSFAPSLAHAALLRQQAASFATTC
jgi:hypothetical protein